jgi:hypothetical protein
VNKFDLLFDSKQYAAAFGAAIGDSNSPFRPCRPDATAHAEGEAASVGAGFLRDDDQQVMHDVQLRRNGK